MDSKDLDVKMKIRRIINTPGISDRTIIGNIQGDKGVGKLINTLNQKLEEEIKDEEKITTIKLVNPVKVTNPDVTIYDYDSDIYMQLNDEDHLFFKIDNYKFEAIYLKPRSFYSKINLEINNDFSTYLKEYGAVKIDDMFSMMITSMRIYLDLEMHNIYLKKDHYLTDDEVNTYKNLNKIVAIDIKKPLCLTNRYLNNPFILDISEPTITTDKISAIATTNFADVEVKSLNYAPTMVTIFSQISNTKLVFEGSTISNNGQKIIFKPIYSEIGILYPVMTYKESDYDTNQHKPYRLII